MAISNHCKTFLKYDQFWGIFVISWRDFDLILIQRNLPSFLSLARSRTIIQSSTSSSLFWPFMSFIIVWSFKNGGGPYPDSFAKRILVRWDNLNVCTWPELFNISDAACKKSGKGIVFISFDSVQWWLLEALSAIHCNG